MTVTAAYTLYLLSAWTDEVDENDHIRKTHVGVCTSVISAR